ncbi:MAG: hypothetical protein A2Y62_03985 [Candidatus Fischerbacteria bacterium RBG_13_37_8]|uniref:Uncharacterized protein n=1 Tax=Candidatus Fischerbacteria bacterium RBG_13_37_8 TaxID=1817863 RepID=A0A1F5V5H2_9BACT|nr:MAG: hypothetical protein A2Y62_03985 [Candidatus Fischerbacteria bacterium RBG_13_37_8]
MTALDDFTAMRGIRLTEKQMKEAIQFIREYIEHAPSLLDYISKAAYQTGIYEQISYVLDAAEQYFLEPHDLIPDHLGLLGLLAEVSYFVRKNQGEMRLGE